MFLTEYLGALRPAGTAGTAVVLARKIWRTRMASLMSKTVPITPANDGSGSFDEVPAALKGFDNDDHKFLAVAIAEGSTPPILAAMDGEWWERRKELTKEGLSVQFPCSPDLIRKAAEKRASLRTGARPTLGLQGATMPRRLPPDRRCCCRRVALSERTTVWICTLPHTHTVAR